MDNVTVWVYKCKNVMIFFLYIFFICNIMIYILEAFEVYDD